MQSINITSISPTTPRLLSVATLFSYTLVLQPQAYGYSSPLDAYLSLNSTLSNDVYNGNFSSVIESMSNVPIYSTFYAMAYSNYIHFAPYPYFPTGTPIMLPTAAPANHSLSFFALSVSSASTRNYFLQYIYISISVFVALSIISMIAWYLYRRSRSQALKSNALSKIAGMQQTGEIIPEESDNVEWGISHHQFQFYDEMPYVHGGLHTYYEWDDEWDHGMGNSEPTTFSKKTDLLTL